MHEGLARDSSCASRRWFERGVRLTTNSVRRPRPPQPGCGMRVTPANRTRQHSPPRRRPLHAKRELGLERTHHGIKKQITPHPLARLRTRAMRWRTRVFSCVTGGARRAPCALRLNVKPLRVAKEHGLFRLETMLPATAHANAPEIRTRRCGHGDKRTCATRLPSPTFAP